MIVGFRDDPDQSPDLGQIGLQEQVVPDLVIQDGMVLVFDEREADRLALVCRPVVSLSFSSRSIVRSTCNRSADSPKSSVAPMVSGIVATGVTWAPTPTARSVTRGSRSFSNPIERNTGRESRPVFAGLQQDLQRRRLAEDPVSGECPFVDPLQCGRGSRTGS